METTVYFVRLSFLANGISKDFVFPTHDLEFVAAKIEGLMNDVLSALIENVEQKKFEKFFDVQDLSELPEPETESEPQKKRKK